VIRYARLKIKGDKNRKPAYGSVRNAPKGMREGQHRRKVGGKGKRQEKIKEQNWEKAGQEKGRGGMQCASLGEIEAPMHL